MPDHDGQVQENKVFGGSAGAPSKFGDFVPKAAIGATHQETAGIPAIHVQRRSVDAMLTGSGQGNLADIEQAIDRDLTPRSMPLGGWTCRL